MKTSSSKPAMSTSPDDQFSLHNITYCLKIYQNCWLEYFISFFWKFIHNVTNNWYFYQNLHLNLSEAIVSVPKPPSPYQPIGKQYFCAFQSTAEFQIILVYNTQHVVHLCFRIILIHLDLFNMSTITIEA